MPLLRTRHQRESALNERVKREATIAREPVGGATPAGDERRLRGIPCIARGVSGAVPDTRPGLTAANAGA